MRSEGSVLRKNLDTGIFEALDLGLHWGVALVLVILAAAVFVRTLITAWGGVRSDFMGTMLQLLNDLFFVIIVLEVLSTVTSRFRHHDFQLRPFLVVGTISVVRHILMVGAHMSMERHTSPAEFTREIVELGTNGVLALALVVAYYLLIKAEPRLGSDGREASEANGMAGALAEKNHA